MKSEAIVHEQAINCLNCEATVGGHFCHQCGQETRLHMPSAGEFLHEFIGHYVALEGKLWKSLLLLLFKPGRLTLEYLQGRRARYVLPLRLYLSFSLIFFALFKYGMHDIKIGQHEAPLAAVHASKAPSASDKAPAASDKAQAASSDDDDEDQPAQAQVVADKKVKVSTKLKTVTPKLFSNKLDKFLDQSGEEMGRALYNAFFSYGPYAIFCMMPLFAAYLKLLYLGSGRRYGEHLLFALHANAFAFLMLSLELLTPSFIPYLHGLLALWLVFYLPTAMRRVYGGSRRATALRWIVLMALHGISLTVAIAGALALAVMA